MVYDEICPTCGNKFCDRIDARLARLDAIESAKEKLDQGMKAFLIGKSPDSNATEKALRELLSLIGNVTDDSRENNRQKHNDAS